MELASPGSQRTAEVLGRVHGRGGHDRGHREEAGGLEQPQRRRPRGPEHGGHHHHRVSPHQVTMKHQIFGHATLRNNFQAI